MGNVDLYVCDNVRCEYYRQVAEVRPIEVAPHAYAAVAIDCECGFSMLELHRRQAARV